MTELERFLVEDCNIPVRISNDITPSVYRSFVDILNDIVYNINNIDIDELAEVLFEGKFIEETKQLNCI